MHYFISAQKNRFIDCDDHNHITKHLCISDLPLILYIPINVPDKQLLSFLLSISKLKIHPATKRSFIL
ncbi:uncharacterized protein LOC119649573 isoform X2 [Hermetia illucens]|uniref:uncharacterized protein LOC119649573 isoform X2 n=1 Tax=Hermetia illucens TaxID=343691 RepID=UPI0018CC70E0|nr:uncharacterized protein LOC119649573 isoform X2 [Hermetia illucens]